MLFEVRIPTIESKERTMYAIKPVPIRRGNEILELRTKSEYITVDRKLEEITYMSSAEFQACNVLTEGKFICRENDLVFAETEQNL